MQQPNRLEQLRIITRGHNASAVGGDIAKTIFCNPFSLFSLIGACKPKVYTHTKEQLDGDLTGVKNISVSYAYPKYKEMLQQNLTLKEAGDYSQVKFYFIHGDNYLVYDEDHYKLVVQFSINLQGRDFLCQEEKAGFSQEQWQANQYALAVSEGKKLVDRCFEKFDNLHFKNIGHIIEANRGYYL